MSNQKYNQNNRFHSFDKYQQRKNNQNQVVYPTNNIRNISNYRNNRNYENYLEDDDHSGIRIYKQKNPGRFNNYAENNQNKYNYNNSNYNYKYNNGLEKPNVTRKNEKGFNHNLNKEIKINASYLYNRALSADKYIENEKNNFNENNLLANEDYKKRRQKKERFHHNNSNNKEFISIDFETNNHQENRNNHNLKNFNEELITNDNKHLKKDIYNNNLKFDDDDVERIKNNHISNSNKYNIEKNGIKNYLNRNNYNNNQYELEQKYGFQNNDINYLNKENNDLIDKMNNINSNYNIGGNMNLNNNNSLNDKENYNNNRYTNVYDFDFQNNPNKQQIFRHNNRIYKNQDNNNQIINNSKGNANKKNEKVHYSNKNNFIFDKRNFNPVKIQDLEDKKKSKNINDQNKIINNIHKENNINNRNRNKFSFKNPEQNNIINKNIKNEPEKLLLYGQESNNNQQDNKSKMDNDNQKENNNSIKKNDNILSEYIKDRYKNKKPKYIELKEKKLRAFSEDRKNNWDEKEKLTNYSFKEQDNEIINQNKKLVEKFNIYQENKYKISKFINNSNENIHNDNNVDNNYINTGMVLNENILNDIQKEIKKVEYIVINNNHDKTIKIEPTLNKKKPLVNNFISDNNNVGKYDNINNKYKNQLNNDLNKNNNIKNDNIGNKDLQIQNNFNIQNNQLNNNNNNQMNDDINYINNNLVNNNTNKLNQNFNNNKVKCNNLSVIKFPNNNINPINNDNNQIIQNNNFMQQNNIINGINIFNPQNQFNNMNQVVNKNNNFLLNNNNQIIQNNNFMQQNNNINLNNFNPQNQINNMNQINNNNNQMIQNNDLWRVNNSFQNFNNYNNLSAISPFNNNFMNIGFVQNMPMIQNFMPNMFNGLNNQFNMFNNQFQNQMFNQQMFNNNQIQIKSNNYQRSHSSPHLIVPSITKIHANGLQNIGATCYMNATIQCLAHVKTLTNNLLKNRIEIKNDKYKKKLANAFVEVLENLWEKNLEYYAPYNFKALISKMNPLFEGVKANDSKDLVLFLLETMHNELNKVKNIPQFDDNINQYNFLESFQSFGKYFGNNFQSIISDIFYGMYNSQMKCLNCNIITHNVQCYNILIIPLEEVRKYKNRMYNYVTIRECFEYYQKLEYMSEENQIYCNNCKQMANSANNTTLIIGPKILVINLNRGKGIQYNIKLDFTETLNIHDFIYFKDSPFKYKLIGVVTHFGPSGDSGHFIAFCRSFVNDQWYKYNDAMVTSSSFIEARDTGIPYILFYQFEEK